MCTCNLLTMSLIENSFEISSYFSVKTALNLFLTIITSWAYMGHICVVTDYTWPAGISKPILGLFAKAVCCQDSWVMIQYILIYWDTENVCVFVNQYSNTKRTPPPSS